eukprot:301522-Amphidinium_carterae.1
MVADSKKKGTQDDAQRMAKKLLHSHDEIIGLNASDEEGLDEQQRAAFEAGQSSFDGAGVHGVDLRNRISGFFPHGPHGPSRYTTVRLSNLGPLAAIASFQHNCCHNA